MGSTSLYSTHQPRALHFSFKRPKTALQCLPSASRHLMTFDFFEGPAGSGKTFSMVAHARQLVENDLLGEGQRMLALTFMNGARRRLTASLSAEASFRRKFDCLTFDSFAQTLTRRRSAKLTDVMRQQAVELGQFNGPCFLASELLRDAEVRSWVARTYPLVLVDEAQDLDVHRQGIILGLKECCTAVVAADSFQCLSDGQETAKFIDQLGCVPINRIPLALRP